MKKIFTLFVAMVLAVLSYAQPANGSLAPDFNLYEIDKTTGNMITDHTINLYDMLNDYKTVYIDVSATTCGPCYNFHQTGTLDGLYNNYGPNSTVNDSRVLFIEGASTGSSWAAINGSAGSSYWDCTHVYGSTTELVPYPVVPLRLSPNYVANDGSCNYYTFHTNYSIGAFPTIMMVCPNRMVYDLYPDVTSNATTYHNQIASRCPAWTNTNDALLSTQKLMASMYFCENDIVPTVLLQNMGTTALTSATLRVTYGSNVQTYEWTGNLAQFATEVVTLSPVTPTQDGSQSMTIEVINANGVADQGSSMNTFTANFGVQRTSDLATSSQTFSSASALGLWTLVDNTDGDFGIYNGALRLRAWDAPSGATGECYAPLMNFSNSPTPSLKFDYAHRRYSSASEKLQVMVSSDCGATWTTVWEKSGAALATVTSGSGEFNATSSQYQTAAVDLTSYAGQSRVIIKFVFTSGYGNNVFIDNVEISDSPVNVESVDESVLAIFPNPVSDVLTINYDKAISQIDVYDVNGKLVKTFTTVGSTVNVSDLSSGVYMLNMQTEDGLVVKKIVKE
ncbi:MAG: T9SS type A sorting domain-containing protein [Bacteroidales bacterium]|nr:T9SS type A sorting domain-containing protein [Bacteroidales bacterium]